MSGMRRNGEREYLPNLFGWTCRGVDGVGGSVDLRVFECRFRLIHDDNNEERADGVGV